MGIGTMEYLLSLIGILIIGIVIGAMGVAAGLLLHHWLF